MKLLRRSFLMLLGVSLITICFTLIASAGPGAEVRAANALGPASAPVTIEFFTDLQCPQCARYEPIIKSLKTEFGDKVRLVLRHYPLESHQNAAVAAVAAEAAANQGKFWELAEALYKTQWIWAKAATPNQIFRDQARQVGLDIDQFERDLDSSQCRARVAADTLYAESIGINAAPSVVINGYHVPNSEFSEDGFRAAIKSALAKASQ